MSFFRISLIFATILAAIALLIIFSGGLHYVNEGGSGSGSRPIFPEGLFATELIFFNIGFIATAIGLVWAAEVGEFSLRHVFSVVISFIIGKKQLSIFVPLPLQVTFKQPYLVLRLHLFSYFNGLAY